MVVILQLGTLYTKMTKTTMIWLFVLIFVALTSYLVIAEDTIGDLLGDEKPIETFKDERIAVSFEVEQAEPLIKDILDNSQITEIDCKNGVFYWYKEGYTELKQAITIDCANLTNAELEQLRNDLINERILTIEKFNKDSAQIKETDIRLERVRLVK